MAKYSGKHVCVTDSMSNKKHVILVFKILSFANEALTGLPIYVSDLLALGWFELIHIKHILLKVIAKALDRQYALDLQWHALYSSSNCNLMSCFQFISYECFKQQPVLNFLKYVTSQRYKSNIYF